MNAHQRTGLASLAGKMARLACGLLLLTALSSPAMGQKQNKVPKVPKPLKGKPSATTVPEFDAGMTAGALTLVVGGTLMLANRRWRR